MTEAEKRYFAETACVLRREGFHVEQLENGHLNVVLNGHPLRDDTGAHIHRRTAC